ncbi:MAG: hypothetical protein U5K81_09255 [Trueperaceae bacterium]|nr:hypothetical protein [Trueperaceae bacterium]
MSTILPWFLIAQAAMFPQLAPGSEVQVVSPDLVRVYAHGVLEGSVLTLEGATLPAGGEVRVLVFPPDADAEESAAVMSGARAVRGRMTAGGDGLWILPEGGGDATLLRDLLRAQGIELLLRVGENAP